MLTSSGAAHEAPPVDGGRHPPSCCACTHWLPCLHITGCTLAVPRSERETPASTTWHLTAGAGAHGTPAHSTTLPGPCNLSIHPITRSFQSFIILPGLSALLPLLAVRCGCSWPTDCKADSDNFLAMSLAASYFCEKDPAERLSLSRGTSVRLRLSSSPTTCTCTCWATSDFVCA